MSRPYAPAPWLSNPHLLTVWGRLFRRTEPIPFVREQWETPDDDTIDVLRIAAAGPESPTFLLLHGLEGSESSHYVGGTISEARSRGWQSNLLVFRTCNGSLNRQPRSYHSGETSDLDFVVRRLLLERPHVPLILAGVSLGGNVLLKWLGEQGDRIDSRVKAATAVSVPFDLARSSRRIDQGLSRIYSRRFLRTLKAKALAKIARHPGIADPRIVAAAPTLWDFDNTFTGPVHGFGGAEDYYTRSSSIHFLASIRIPTLLLSARDDPFHPPGLLDEVEEITRNNPVLCTEFVARGGHIGFIEGAVPWSVSSYSERRAVEFAESVLAMSRSATGY